MISYACLALKYSIRFVTEKKKNVKDIRIDELCLDFYDENNNLVKTNFNLISFNLPEDVSNYMYVGMITDEINSKLKPLVDSSEFKEFVSNNGKVYIYSSSSSNDLGCLEYTKSYINVPNEFIDYTLENYMALDIISSEHLYVRTEHGSRRLTDCAIQRRLLMSVLGIPNIVSYEDVNLSCKSLNDIKNKLQNNDNIYYVDFENHSHIIEKYIEIFKRQLSNALNMCNYALPLAEQEKWIIKLGNFFDENNWVFTGENHNQIKNNNTKEIYDLNLDK